MKKATVSGEVFTASDYNKFVDENIDAMREEEGRMNSDFQTQAWVCNYMVGLLPAGISTVLEPTPGNGNLVRALNGYQVTAPLEFFNTIGRFDAVVMNPPFTPMELGYRILYSVMEMSDIIIALMPWMTLINSEKRTRAIENFGLMSISHLPRSAFAGARVQTCILEMRRGFTGETIIRFPMAGQFSNGRVVEAVKRY